MQKPVRYISCHAVPFSIVLLRASTHTYLQHVFLLTTLLPLAFARTCSRHGRACKHRCRGHPSAEARGAHGSRDDDLESTVHALEVFRGAGHVEVDTAIMYEDGLAERTRGERKH